MTHLINNRREFKLLVNHVVPSTETNLLTNKEEEIMETVGSDIVVRTIIPIYLDDEICETFANEETNTISKKMCQIYSHETESAYKIAQSYDEVKKIYDDYFEEIKATIKIANDGTNLT